jgi:hypothetical protein
MRHVSLPRRPLLRAVALAFLATVTTEPLASGVLVSAVPALAPVASAQETCSFAISPSSESFSADGGQGSATVTTPSSCPWTAVSHDDWITVTSGGPGPEAGP